MPVIPFNPGGSSNDFRGTRRPEPDEPRGRACTGEPAADETGAPSRLAQLEHALLSALRENARNWARAERLERILHDRQAARDPSPRARRD